MNTVTRIASDSLRSESELVQMARLAAPIVLAELGWMAMGLVDTMMVGRVSAEAIAAVGLGTMVFYATAMAAGGILLGMDTLVSQAFGAGNRDDCRHTLVAGLWVALLGMPAVMVIVRLFDPLLVAIGIKPDVLDAALPYVHTLNWSVPPLLVYFALRRYVQGLHIVRPVMWTLLTANLVNLAGNWVLVFGRYGAPRLGAVGSAWSTFASRIYMALVLAVVVYRADPQILKTRWRPDAKRIRELLKLGVPAAGQIVVEVAVFAVVTFLIGRLGALELAGNQIALATVSTTFMVPLGISSAAAVRVGHGLGRGDPRAAVRSGWTALALGAAVMSCSAVMLLTVPQMIARLFTAEAEVIAAGAVLLRIAAFFQLFDGLQVVATGALRGVGDTRTPMLCHFAGYWILGLPVGAWLCFSRGWGASGLWAGLSAGLIVIGIVLALAWRRAARRVAMVK